MLRHHFVGTDIRCPVMETRARIDIQAIDANQANPAAKSMTIADAKKGAVLALRMLDGLGLRRMNRSTLQDF